MRVQRGSLTVMGPPSGTDQRGERDRHRPTASSTASSTGVARPFREPGIQAPDPLPAGAPRCVPRFDANPERLRVDSDGQPGATRST